MGHTHTKLPAKGMPAESVLEEMRRLRVKDARWREGKTWSLVYFAGDRVTDFLKEAYTAFFSENALNPSAFPSLRRFEAEVISMISLYSALHSIASSESIEEFLKNVKVD